MHGPLQRADRLMHGVGRNEIVPVGGGERDVALWADALHRVLANPESSFAHAASLRD
jgi:hypothetical protein